MTNDNLDEQYQALIDLVKDSEGQHVLAITDIMIDHFKQSIKVLKLEKELEELKGD